MNIGYLLNNTAGKYPEKTALVSDEGRWTFKDLNQRTNRLAGAMLNAGLIKGDRVAILLYNSKYFVEAYFAAVKVGLVVTPVNFRLTASLLAYVRAVRNSLEKLNDRFESIILPSIGATIASMIIPTAIVISSSIKVKARTSLMTHILSGSATG